MKNIILKVFYYISVNSVFSIIVFLFIIFNTVILCLDRYPISSTEVTILEILNQVCTWFFFVEMVIKLIGLGPQNYV